MNKIVSYLMDILYLRRITIYSYITVCPGLNEDILYFKEYFNFYLLE